MVSEVKPKTCKEKLGSEYDDKVEECSERKNNGELVRWSNSNCGCVDDGDEDDKSEAIKSVPIDDVCPDIFGHLLYYVYGGTVSDKVLQVRINRLSIL